MIEIFLAHRHLPADAITTALKACVDIGVVDPAVVIVEARRHTQTTDPVVIPIGSLSDGPCRAPSYTESRRNQVSKKTGSLSELDFYSRFMSV